MATQKGVWNLQQVRDKQLQSLWTYSTNGDGGKLFTWGNNNDGQLGLNQPTSTKYSSPVQIPGTTWTNMSIDGGGYAQEDDSWAVVKTDGTLWCWGDNENGQLGDGTVVEKSSPVQIPGSTWKYVESDGDSRAAIKTDGTLWVWGRGDIGQLGDNSNGPSAKVSSPKQVPGSTWSRVSVGYRQLLATKTDGTLWTWGSNSDGAGGFNEAPSNRKSSPVQIPGSTWSRPIAGREIAGGVKTDGTLWMWGRGSDGALGNNDRTNRSSPIQVPGTTWKQFTSGSQPFVIAVKTDGTAWAWGDNVYGQLGLNQSSGPPSTSKISSPTQIGSGTDWSMFSASYYMSAGTKTDGTLWVMGDNGNATPSGTGGALGLNDTISRSSPTQIPGTNWSEVGLGNAFGMAKQDL